MSAILDISPRVSPTLGVWPGDVPFRRDVALDLDQGDHLTLSSITATLHLGAHADAQSHYRRGAADIAARSLDLYFGPCEVVTPLPRPFPRATRILPEHLPGGASFRPRAPRVLFRTLTFPDPDDFTTDFASLSPELIDLLAPQGVRLVGLDTPSVDPFDSKLLETHQALARHDVANLEGLVLAHVEDGLYTLVALPLRLEGCDASPVRAALVRT